MTASTAGITPTTTPAVGAVPDAETTLRRTRTLREAFDRASQPDYFAWLDHVSSAAACTRPIRLRGDFTTVTAAGEMVHRHTDELPDAAIYKACGNRRAALCPACSAVYQADAYQLLLAGLVGGKGVPDTVAEHPANFATLTAPSFGPVHSRVVTKHTCNRRRHCDCRAQPCHPRRAVGVCEHGQPAVCWVRHEEGDPRIGQPLCLDCYDHDHQVVWNLFSGELWHRTKDNIQRHLDQLARERGIPSYEVVTAGGRTRRISPVRVSHGKAAELQARAAVHFHALLRLDGVDPDDKDAIVPPPAALTAADLDQAIRAAVAHTMFTTPAHPDRPEGWDIAWGDPDKALDTQQLTASGTEDLTERAGYLAKYATKSTEATGHASTRITGEIIDDWADPTTHTGRLIDACWRLGQPTGSARTPLHQPSRAKRLGPRWICPTCGTTTSLRVCVTCHPSTPRPRPGSEDKNTVNHRLTENRSPDNAPTDGHTTEPDNPYGRLRRWAHMLGYGGHFLTKARRYSTTFAVLRATRVAHRRSETPAEPALQLHVQVPDTDAEIRPLTYAGTGWRTTGDAYLANTAAALARERHRIGREELAHEHATSALPIAA